MQPSPEHSRWDPSDSSGKWPVLHAALGLVLIQAPGMEELLRQSMPPDDDQADHIEKVFLESQIDGLSAEFAHVWLASNQVDLVRIATQRTKGHTTNDVTL